MKNRSKIKSRMQTSRNFFLSALSICPSLTRHFSISAFLFISVSLSVIVCLSLFLSVSPSFFRANVISIFFVILRNEMKSKAHTFHKNESREKRETKRKVGLTVNHRYRTILELKLPEDS